MKKKYIKPAIAVIDVDCTEVIASSGGYGGTYVEEQSGLGQRSNKGGWGSQYEDSDGIWGN